MLIRTALLPARLTWGVSKLSARGGYLAGRASVVGTYRAGQMLGYRRLLTLGAGVGLGLLLAPTSGEELRRRLRGAFEQRTGAGSDDEIAKRVEHRLSESPRTWHLPQPTVDVVAGTAILTGAAPHATGRDDIERAAAEVEGVVEVDNRLDVGTPHDGEP